MFKVFFGKRIYLVVIVLLIGILINGCGGQQSKVEGKKEQLKLPPELDTPIIKELAQKAKAEGGVINSYGMPDTWANYGEIYKEFERLFGIKHQDIDMGSTVVLSRMTEENASKNDVADLKPSLAEELAKRGLTSEYKPAGWDKIPEGQKGVGRDGSVWQAAYKGTIGWIVNTKLVKKIPRTWRELDSDEYKGLLAYLDPRATGTGINTVEAASLAMSGNPYNYKAGIEFLARLHKRGVVASVDPKVTVSKFQRGEVGILINFDYNLLKWRDELGVPSEIVIPSDGTVTSGGSVIMARNAPHPNTAKLFMEFLFSKYGQQLYAGGYVTPIRPDVELPPELAKKFPPKEAYSKAIFIDYQKESSVSDQIPQAWATAVGQ
ncbi:putative spermidine/putrescine transport system substrate-binding protein [Thermanaeromonas toyohensis ToBE]|uniref:Putative spermidine/putrescine transport system substrate-binding protein n=1 Tax=Thermanaeromonas toyohensis ToBE TaxID=698762 RepID=A0A1W1VY56_9FIRM|nr:extracellular solute-binding protein [Thermanaeromonas toyohensis]SMB98183.1 putative spermidine/putrescine transport system substrate-binding protein [Thermanaeromonas toyohensis ToBE]